MVSRMRLTAVDPSAETATFAFEGRDGRMWARPEIVDAPKVRDRHPAGEGALQFDRDVGIPILDQARIGERQQGADVVERRHVSIVEAPLPLQVEVQQSGDDAGHPAARRR